MLGVIASLPAVEGLWADVEVVTGKMGLVPTGVVVIKPFESLPGLPGEFNLKPCQTRDSRNYSTYYSHSPPYADSVTHLPELVH